jgi:hypothetical protein
LVEGGGELFDEIDVFVDDVISAFDGGGGGRTAASCDDENVGVGERGTSADFTNEVGAGELWHHEVGDYKGRSKAIENGQSFQSIASYFHGVAAVLEETAYGVTDEQGIVHDESGLRQAGRLLESESVTAGLGANNEIEPRAITLVRH